MDSELRLIVLGSLFVLSLGGCDPHHCGAWATEVDGVCVGEAPPEPAEDPPTVEEWVRTMGECIRFEPAEPALDLGTGCVGGACLGDTLQAFVDNLGEEPSCEPYGEAEWTCTFASGVKLRQLTPAEGGEGPEPAVRITSIEVSGGFVGTTREGLGLGTSPACFVEELGMPDLAFLSPRRDGTWDLALATWDEAGVEILDGVHPILSSTADDATDRIVLFE